MTIKNLFSSLLSLCVLVLADANTNTTKAAISRPGALKKKIEAPASTLEHSTNCQAIIEHFENVYGIPPKLLSAIATVESKKSPWAVNAKKRSHFFASKEAAIKYIQTLQAKGVKNINIGCMQINLQSHGKKFKSLGDILTPYHNIEFAAKLMKHLHTHYGSWEQAVRYYHSASSHHNNPYKERVYSAWGRAESIPTYSSAQVDLTKINGKKHPFVKVVFGPGAGVSRKAF